MDMNVVVIAGTLAAAPEHRVYESGAGLWKLLVTTRMTEPRKRVDVLPVTYWDTDEAEHMTVLDALDRGDRVWIVGTLQRRFWSSDGGVRRSSVELIANHIEATEATATDAIEAMVPQA
jgi:single-stranded DNA-binding protein